MTRPSRRDGALVPATARTDSSTVWIALPPVILTAVVTMIGIGSRSLWNDEYATWRAATLSFGGLIQRVRHIDAVIAPYYVGMHGWVELAGISPTALRFPSLLAMAVSAGLLALVGRRLFDAGVGLCAGLAFGLLPMVSRYGQEARPYAFAMGGVILATLLLLRAIEGASWRRWVLYGCAVFFVGAMNIVAVTVLAAHAVLLVHEFASHRRTAVLRWIVVVAVALVGLSPFVIEGSRQSFAIDWIQGGPAALRRLPVNLFGTAGLAFTLMALAGVAAVVRWRGERGAVVLLVVWALFPPAFTYVTFPVLHAFLSRYLLFTLPAWVLLAAALVGAVARRIHPTSRRVFGGVTAALLLTIAVVGLPAQVDVRQNPLANEPDFHRAAAIVESHREAGDAIVFTGTRRNGRRSFAYEHAIGVIGTPRDVLLGPGGAARFRVRECAPAESCLAGVQRIWVVYSGGGPHGMYAALSDAATRVLTRDFTQVTFARGQGFTILRLDRRASP